MKTRKIGYNILRRIWTYRYLLIISHIILCQMELCQIVLRQMSTWRTFLDIYEVIIILVIVDAPYFFAGSLYRYTRIIWNYREYQNIVLGKIWYVNTYLTSTTISTNLCSCLKETKAIEMILVVLFSLAFLLSRDVNASSRVDDIIVKFIVNATPILFPPLRLSLQLCIGYGKTFMIIYMLYTCQSPSVKENKTFQQ